MISVKWVINFDLATQAIVKSNQFSNLIAKINMTTGEVSRGGETNYSKCEDR